MAIGLLIKKYTQLAFHDNVNTYTKLQIVRWLLNMK